ncbi:MAG: hypothetical protein KGS44_05335 [Alphaproteobacteria bacterium]|jgi:hypothetical protein|nr:hypothetical protein [Alphaproteobacteria bacterium]
MDEGQWRDLIESYVAGRLSADSFKRRFLEAFAASRLAPPAIQDLFFTVDAYGGDPLSRGHDVADDAALTIAARRCLLHLAPSANASTPPPQQPGVGSPRPALRAPPGVAAGLGLGCLLIALWAAVGVLQLFAIAEQVDRVTALGPVISTLSASVLTFVPILGSVVAFFGAKDGWHWAPWAAALVFLALPITAQTLSVLTWRGRRR